MGMKNLRRLLFYLPGMLALWWALTDGDTGTWWFGLPLAVIAALLSIRLLPAKGRLWSLKGLLRFIPFFLYQSLHGGLDVAVRALRPRLPIAPALIHYSVRLPEGAARIFFADVISLLPGTLSAELDDVRLRVHVLDEGLPVTQKLSALEDRVAELFGAGSPTNH